MSGVFSYQLCIMNRSKKKAVPDYASTALKSCSLRAETSAIALRTSATGSLNLEGCFVQILRQFGQTSSTTSLRVRDSSFGFSVPQAGHCCVSPSKILSQVAFGHSCQRSFSIGSLLPVFGLSNDSPTLPQSTAFLQKSFPQTKTRLIGG
jgi:hypothetical protein